ncbi:MAG: sulfatase-like hydrolase/transferase [Anaerolineales bacterium]|nr:sulfatase-like hydrolase/transferase [Anaerolineales bacterium]
MARIIKSFKSVFSNKRFTSALIFVVLLYGFEEWLFGFPQRQFFHNIVIFSRTRIEINEAALSGMISFIFCFLFIWAALESKNFFRWLYFTLFFIPSLVQYGFWKAVGRFLSTPDLHIANATPFATWRGASVLYFNWHFLIPVIVFFLALLLIRGTHAWRKSLTIFISLFALTLLTGFPYFFLNTSVLNFGASLSSFYQTISLFAAENVFVVQREAVKIHKPNNPPENNIVLIIDESIRGDHLSINGYDRETTPFLDSLIKEQDSILNWGLASASATCSYLANSFILTGAQPGIDSFEDTDKYPTLFQYAKATGYTTYYIDAQTNVLWNGLNANDLIDIDKWYKAADLGDDQQADFRAADLINQIVSESAGNLIVLNKRGVHFLYEESYPPEATIWTPMPTDYQLQPDLVKNPYDNGIRYNVDDFFKELFQNPNLLDQTLILYTADHGDTIFEDGATWLHCNYTTKEATVPLIIFGKNLPSVNLDYHASHQNILPTLLDWMNIPLKERARPYAPSLFSATAAENKARFFLSGNLDVIQYSENNLNNK